MHDPTPSRPRAQRSLLITAGPTHEPIDAVRYIGNRSSGRLGVELADTAAARGWEVTLLLGPTARTPSHSRVRLCRFRTTSDLAALLALHGPSAGVIIMAAAVADYRPVIDPGALETKTRRMKEGLTLRLEATPDLLAGCSARRRPGQLIVGFALEPREDLLASARSKLDRKGIDLIVANPLETMDSDRIDAVVLGRPGTPLEEGRSTPGPVDKSAFAGWLLELVEEVARGPAR